jgi:hypothetical protein
VGARDLLAGAAAACSVLCEDGREAMIAWIIGIHYPDPFALEDWGWRSKEVREYLGQPKFQFLRSIGIPSQEIQQAGNQMFLRRKTCRT